MMTLIKWASTAVLMLAVLLALFIGFSSIVIGWQFSTVMSGSMSPSLKVGGIVATRPVDPATIEVGDIITYYSPQLGKTIVHRVIGKHMDNGLYFITQGDANSAPDREPVPAQNVVGKVSAHVPFLGYVSQFAKTPFGSVLLLALPGAMIIATEIRNIRAELSRLRKGRKATGAAEALATVRLWNTGLRTEDWMSWDPAADSHI